MKLLRPIAAAFAHVLLWCCLATAQQAGDTAAPSGEAKAKPAPVRVEESRPWVYYLPDQQGRLQPVLDFKYQDFVTLYKLKNRLEHRDEPPRFTLQRMTATGTAEKEYAELEFQFQVLIRDDGWVRVPLRLDQGVLRGAVKYKGPGEQFLEYDGSGDGYVCWLRGKAESQHEISMAVMTPVAAFGDQTRLKLFVPRATASELKLTVPVANAVGKVSEGATLLPSTTNEKTTALNVAGLGGEFLLTWFAASPHAAETPLVLEASGSVLTRLDSRSITAEAALSVRSYGAAFDRFTVRLPPDAELAPGTSHGMVLTALDAEKDVRGTRQRRVLVQLPRKTAGPVDVHLATRRNYDPTKDSSWCELAGFEVVDAARQWGTLAVAAAGDWQVLWGTSSDLRETDQLPDTLRKEDLVAGFEYSAQPYSLTARLTPRKTRISVDPHYIVQVDRDSIRLAGKLTYAIRGAKIATLEIAIPGWELDEVGPESLVAVDGVTVNGNNIAIPLAQPTTGAVELQLRAHRAVDAKASSLTATLPQPQANMSGPMSVTVIAADNVELTPRSRGISGLTRQQVAPQQQEKLPERQQEPLYYRGTGGPAVFAADFRMHVQRVSVDVATQVTLRQRMAEVEQRQSYAIAYEPIDRLAISVPRVLAATKRIQASCEGKPLELVAEAEDLIGADPSSLVSMRAALPGPRIGTCELTLRYSVPIAEPTPQRPTLVSLPLPMPEAGQLAANRLTMAAARNTRASVRKHSEWTAIERETTASDEPGELRLASAKLAHRADLNLRWEADDSDATIVDRAWVQSWFNSSERQDRAAYQLTTGRKEIEVQLPAGVQADQTLTLVDGKRIEVRTVSEGRLAIPLSGSRDQRRFVIELLYRFSDARPPIGALHLEFPRFAGNVWVRRMYWQLVLPGNEHVAIHPDGFTGEFTWSWQGYFWGRKPLLDQEQLETWVGATSRSPLPERTNQYLFSTIGNAEYVALRTAVRTWIVLMASGASLVLGLLLIYVPTSRRPGSVLALSIALLAAGWIAPEPTLLFAQAASLGLVLTLVAGLLERGVASRRRTLPRKEPSSSSRVELDSIPTPYRSPLVTDPASTEMLVPPTEPPSQGNSRQ